MRKCTATSITDSAKVDSGQVSYSTDLSEYMNDGFQRYWDELGRLGKTMLPRGAFSCRFQRTMLVVQTKIWQYFPRTVINQLFHFRTVGDNTIVWWRFPRRQLTKIQQFSDILINHSQKYDSLATFRSMVFDNTIVQLPFRRQFPTVFIVLWWNLLFFPCF